MKFYLYILESERAGILYIGQTNNIEDRLLRHNQNRNKFTKNRGPWQQLFTKEFITRAEAMLLETKLKSWKNPSKIKEWIADQTG